MKRSKYARLDRLIVATVTKYRRSHRLIYVDGRGVAAELARHNPGRRPFHVWELLSRRLQALRKAGRIERVPCSNDWRAV